MIKLKDFVDVNLTSVKPSSSEENKTVVYIYGANSPATRLTEELNASNYKAKLEEGNFDTKATDFINQFFDLGGASLRVIRIVTNVAGSVETIIQNNELFLTEIKNLPVSQVAVVVREASVEAVEQVYDSTGYHYETLTSGVETTVGLDTLLAGITALVEDRGTAFRKLIIKGYKPAVGSTYTEAELVGDEDLETPGLTRDINLVWKLCVDEKDLAGVLAYLSKVTITIPETLRDYSFTEESVCRNMASFLKDITWSTVKDFVNVDIDLEQNGSIINLGGNTSAGFDLIQEFESIYISQRLVTKEMSLLKGKIDLLNAGAVIHSAIIDVMETYYKIGYLIQTQYTGSNIYKNINGKNYCVLAKGEVITGGYKVVILPKKNGSDIHEFPEVEVILNTNKGIRFIKTTGLVL